MIEFRQYDSLAIHYVVVISSPPKDVVLWTTTKIEYLLDILPLCPKNFIQLYNSELYSKYNSLYRDVDYKLSFAHTFESFQETIQFKASFINCVFFVDWNEDIYNSTINSEDLLFFFYKHNIPAGKEVDNCFHDSLTLAKLMRSKKSDVLNRFNDYPNINQLLEPQSHLNGFKMWDFQPAFSLCALHNHFTGDLWRRKMHKIVLLDHSQRMKIIIELLEQTDLLLCDSNIRLNKKIYLSPLLLLAPFFFSDFKKPFNSINKVFAAMIGSEQNFSYENMFEIDDTIYDKLKKNHEEVIIPAKIKMHYLRELELISYLQSTLSKSPMVRLPEQGKSIIDLLSRFYGGRHPKGHKLNKELKKIGKLIARKLIPPELNEYILSFERQLVVISDLPFEWSIVNDTPLSFLFDVCRLPMTPNTRLLRSYTQNKSLKYSIDEDTVKKHLIISSPSEDILKYAPKNFCSLFDMPINNIVCDNIEEVVRAIHDFKPELLIFDCHGGYDNKTNSSFIRVGKQKITYEKVLEHEIRAPLVILSCCNTAPVGFSNSVSNAFLENGSFSILSTFLPINMLSGAFLILGILKRLEENVNKVIYPNWLNFISHNLRTKLFIEYAAILDQKLIKLKKSYSHGKYLGEQTEKMHVEWFENIVSFEHRKSCLKNIKKLVAQSYPKEVQDEVLQVAENIPIPIEFMFYTHLGRPDLVFFKSWYDKHGSLMKEME